MAEQSATDRIQSAVDQYGKKLDANGTKIPAAPTFDDIKGAADFLSIDSDKMLFASICYLIVKNDSEKEKAITWAKQIYADNKNDNELFSSINESPALLPQNIQFISQISKESAQSYIDANPLDFLKSKDLMEVMGINSSLLSPSVKSIEDAVRKLKPSDMTPNLLDEVQDPELKDFVKKSLMKDQVYARGYLETELKLKEQKKDYNQSVIDATFSVVTRYDPQATAPVIPGGSYINIAQLKKLATGAYGADQATDMMIKTSARDSLSGIKYAAANYPAVADAIPVYLAMLPRANALLNNKQHASNVVQMLTALEPSQYAGSSYKIIPEKDVFKLLDGASSGQLYDLITEQQTLYSYSMTQGVYNEVSKRLYDTLKREGKSLSDVAQSSPDRAEMVMRFVHAADNFRRMENFVQATSPEDHLLIAQKLFEKEDESYNISTMSVFIKNLPKNSPALAYIESTIISKALQGNEYEKADMGLLARWYANQNTHNISPENRPFFDRVKADPSFEVPSLNKIKSSNMLDAAGRNFQLYAFYNDQDGIDTFNSFSASLQADGYKSRKQDDFLIFSKEKNGKKIEILVSPPEINGAVIPNIIDYVKGQNGIISLLSGRGHSHHMEKAVELITPDTKIVALGGCWGHNYTSAVLEKSPDAHILATTGVGRMAINNFNTKWMNDQILSGSDINWQGLKAGWERIKTDKTLAKDIKEYVAPDDNIFLLYERRRNELYEIIDQHKDGKAPAPTSSLNQSFMQSVRGVDPQNAPITPSATPVVISQVRKELETGPTA